jgi:hypothetical protein
VTKTDHRTQQPMGGCADKGACPTCHKAPDGSARRLRKL